MLPIHTLFPGFSEPENGLEHAFVLLIWKRSTTNDKIRTVPGLQKQLQTAIILSVAFISSHPRVGVNGL
jgi:hypothetical protein